MGYINRLENGTALRTPVDLLLADIAIRIQLTLTDYDKAVSRYETINDWLDRPDSPLRGRVILMYPQGSMAIGATIAAKLRTDEYDIDIIAELDLPVDTDPDLVLDILYESIRGEPGSRYYDKTERRNRCVTVSYADGMHLDVTPAILLPRTLPKTSWIFHHKPETPEVEGYRLLANPFGFAGWFKEQTPLDHPFAEAFAKRAMDAAGVTVVMDKAEAIPVPEQEGAHQKSKAVIALQLLKRSRNVRYDNRRARRRPPSVMISKLVADHANQTVTLSEEVLRQATQLYARIGEAHRRGQLVSVTNPRCDEDCFTDRWPDCREEQQTYLDDLADFIAKMTHLVKEDCDLATMQAVMAGLFGEHPTGEVFKSFNSALGSRVRGSGTVYQPGTSRLDLGKTGLAPATGASVSSAAARTTPKHGFFGDPGE